jgi:hypothetical protein
MDYDLIEKERDKCKERNLGFIREVCHWILSVDASAALCVNNEGMNPFHFVMLEASSGPRAEKDLPKSFVASLTGRTRPVCRHFSGCVHIFGTNWLECCKFANEARRNVGAMGKPTECGDERTLRRKVTGF